MRELYPSAHERKKFEKSTEIARVGIQAMKDSIASDTSPREGIASPEELAYLMDKASAENAQIIGEVGFNFGCSSYAFLRNNPNAHVVSFDIGEHSYLDLAKGFIDQEFPGRHTLVRGDSTVTLPDFAQKYPDTRFDMAFIDGGHAYEVAQADIRNMQPLCREGAAVVMDDLTPWYYWGEGPARAWTEAVTDGAIVQEEMIRQAEPSQALERIDVITPPAKRIWALGRYALAG